MYELLKRANLPGELQKMTYPEMDALSREIREFLVESVSKTGGHLASNLGVVELTIALHRTFSVPEDSLIFDVGHQSYVHKLLTCRMDKFDTLRQFGGLSGFPKPPESAADAFHAGHSSTAISAALGLAAAAALSGKDSKTVAIVGDAAFSGGLSMEALNHLAHCKHKVIIILNDNQMSIGKAVGGLPQYLNKIRTRSSYYTIKRETGDFLKKVPFIGKPTLRGLKRIKSLLKYWVAPGVVFENLGCKYLGPLDGHNIRQLCVTLEEACKLPDSVLIHVMTKKGKGYAPAEKAPSSYHAVSPHKEEAESCSIRVGKVLCALAEEVPQLAAISPSTPHSTGLAPFMQQYPARFFDTGIAEAHAATFSAGLAKGGMLPVLCVYSSFLQRAYDSLVHDIALSGGHVVLCVDRAGIVGGDGETHQGIFDLSFLTHIPNFSVLCPSDLESLEEMLRYAVKSHRGPIAIRYPRGHLAPLSAPPFVFGKAAILQEGKDITIAAAGRMTQFALQAATLLAEKGISAEVLDLRTVKPLDIDTIKASAAKTGRLLVAEDNAAPGGIGEKLAALFDIPVSMKAFPDVFVPQGSTEALFRLYEMDGEGLMKEAERIVRK